MGIVVNGNVLDLSDLRLTELLDRLGYSSKKIAVSINETFVPRSEWSVRVIQPGDQVEVLSVIEGG